MKHLVVLFAFVLAVNMSAAAQCGSNNVIKDVDCNCGGEIVQATLCQGSGTFCSPVTGPHVSCGKTCEMLTSGDCLSARVLDLRSPSLKHMAMSVSSLALPGKLILSIGSTAAWKPRLGNLKLFS